LDGLHHVQQVAPRVSRHEVPASLDEALRLLEDAPGAARPVAGGTDLLLELQRGARRGVQTLVDLSRIPGLDRIDVAGGVVRLGPLVTHNDVVASPEVVRLGLPLAQACLEVGSPPLRNRATVVGNLVTASPANDTISALLALDATVTLTSRTGERELPLSGFFTGFRQTALEPSELVTAIAFPALDHGWRGLFVKAGNRAAQAISVVHLAVVVRLEGDVVGEARVVLGSVAPVVTRIAAAEDVLVGGPLDADHIGRAADAAAAAVEPIDDVRATAAYRRRVITPMVRRALAALAAGREADRWPARPPLLRSGPRSGAVPAARGAATFVSGGPVTAIVNGRPVTAAGAVGRTLLDWLRDGARLEGTKEGCAEGECGACTVHLDGAAVMSCLVPAPQADGAEIVTVEGLGDGPAGALQEAFVEHGSVQCGFCTPGFLMAGAALLAECDDPTVDEVETALSGNLCRCTGYYRIVDAVRATAGGGPR
jgi:carbon-monoxide dehydrogenase medium subunit